MSLNKPANNFFYKPVVYQARDKVLPDIQSVWSDKNIFPHLFLINKTILGLSSDYRAEKQYFKHFEEILLDSIYSIIVFLVITPEKATI